MCTEQVNDFEKPKLVLSFLRITVLGFSFPTSMLGHRLQVTQAIILMPLPSGHCFPRCWVTEYVHVQSENKTDIFWCYKKVMAPQKCFQWYTFSPTFACAGSLTVVLICISLLSTKLSIFSYIYGPFVSLLWNACSCPSPFFFWAICLSLADLQEFVMNFEYQSFVNCMGCKHVFPVCGMCPHFLYSVYLPFKLHRGTHNIQQNSSLLLATQKRMRRNEKARRTSRRSYEGEILESYAESARESGVSALEAPSHTG